MKRFLKRQKDILGKLWTSGLIEGFYLTGGTALTFRYQHRLSFDLDFFSFPEKAGERFPSGALLEGLERLGKILDLARGTVIASVEGIKVSFFSYPYPLLEEPSPLSLDLRVPIASDKDIASSKLIAVAQRGEKKDFFDLYVLIRRYGWDIEDILALAQKKYALDERRRSFLLKGLSYFEDAEEQKVWLKEHEALSQKEWEEIKTFFRKQTRAFCQKILPR